MGRPLCFWLSCLGWLAAAPVACRSSADAPAAERVVVESPSARPQGKPLRPDEWFDGQIAAAEQEAKDGRLGDALRRIYAARAQRPAGAHAARLEEMLRRLNEAVLELDTIEAWVAAEEDPVVFGDPVRIRIFLRNAGPRPIRIPLQVKNLDLKAVRPDNPEPGTKTSRSLFVLDVVREDRDVRAQVVTTRRRVLRALSRDIDLPPGGTTEIVLNVGKTGNERPLDGFRVFSIGGVLRPAVVEVGGLRRWEAIRLRPGKLRAFRPNYEHLADDPVARIGQAIEKRAPLHLLTAAALVPFERRRDAVDLLVEALQGDRFLDLALFGSLAYLTEVELGRDAEAWRAWWPRVRETYFARPERAPAGPAFGD